MSLDDGNWPFNGAKDAQPTRYFPLCSLASCCIGASAKLTARLWLQSALSNTISKILFFSADLSTDSSNKKPLQLLLR